MVRTDGVRIRVATAPVDMRRSFDRLAEQVRMVAWEDPLSGHLFVFRDRSGERAKILWWDGNVFVLYYKRLERGTFQFPAVVGKSVAIESRELTKLLAGLQVDIAGNAQRPSPRPDGRGHHLRAQPVDRPDAIHRAGYLNIDSNAAQRAFKRVAIGRKNWLVAGTDEAGAGHARLWTLIASSQWHSLDPQPYLTNVLAKIAGSKLSKTGQFLPDVWKAEDAAKPQNG